MDETALVRQMLRGDERAFQEFFDGYFPRVYRFALARVRDEDTAEEIVQATLIQAVRKLHAFRGEASLFTWLAAICRREVSAWHERHSRHEMVALEEDLPDVRARLESLVASTGRPDEQLHQQELARLIRVTLDFLPVRYGDVLEWKYVDGLTVAEIAGRLRLTPKAAESLLTRARDRFRTAFDALTRSRTGTLAPFEGE